MNSPIATACDLLASIIPKGVTVPDNSSRYQSEQEKSWSQTCWLPASCFVRPSNTTDVAAVLDVVKKTGCKFAIRSGGHNANPNFSSDESGVVIDLCDLKSLSLDDDRILHAGAGNRWGEVYTYLEEKNLSVVGGRQRDVGISGYLLGGGMSAFPNLYGLAVDSVKNFEVVLSDSTIVNANAETNPDLFLALKGGNANFGMFLSLHIRIVTRFDIQTHPNTNAQFTVNLYDPSDYANILRATVEVQEAMERDPKYGIFVNFNPTFVAVGLFYAAAADEKPEAFNSFFNLGSLITTVASNTHGTIKSLVEALGPTADPARRQVATATSKISYKVVSKYPVIKTLFYAIQPVSTTMVKAGEDRGGNIMGIKRTPQTWWALFAEWADPAHDATAQQALDELLDGIERIAREHGQFLEFVFPNDAKFSQNVLESYGPENVKKLRDAAAKYDPEQVFQRLQNGGFLLRDV
ncbi:6-hydroxy-D-nicotine oxidase [Biscogniauxia marginata]|nr:6-hydroxy-D-nicotine oxidase [Biscogniauxia marginata]